ncbi:MAG: ABC transporter permease [Chloroflexi bacterium]|nr:ABC transporter permease [Chloroflexota bacterium]MCA2000527.1 ABC transporter permease [Chloroflexota bacterium]
MLRILDIAFKDLLQLSRDFKVFMFLLIMPILFTFLFGYAFGGFGGESDSRLPVGYLALDDHWVTDKLHRLLANSEVIRLEESVLFSEADLEKLVAEGDLAAAVIVPQGYGKAVVKDKTVRLIVIADTSVQAWTTVKAELLSAASRIDGAARTAEVMENMELEGVPFDYAFDQTLSAWEEPPITIHETSSLALEKANLANRALAHTSPGMMLQFAIAGLLTAAQVIVAERKSRTLQRLLTTNTRRIHVALGHYLAIFLLIFAQFSILITFGQIALGVNYFRLPQATLLAAFCAALCISAMGLLIGVLAKNEEQAIIFSLVPMFVFAGLGGAWVPLEVTGETFRVIGHLSPIAWGMDGFENIVARGLGVESVLIPSAALAGYGALFFALAVWRLNAAEEK